MLPKTRLILSFSSGLFLIWLVYLLLNGVSIENKHRYIPSFVLGKEVDFNKDIRPIFNKKCIFCHGGVKKSGGFSLLFEEEALAVNESGKRAIVPGSPGKSELVKRIKHHDPEYRMPLEREPLSKKEIAVLTKWINQGAPWKDHWAYIAPEETAVPEISDDWIITDIDRFILEKLEEMELAPNPMADRYTLLRRVSFDLTGLPPSLEQTRAFLADTSATAYEAVVDSLLASPAYGERWAAMWMDLARYADSKGYEADRPRSIWKYRDWLINAFNDNIPFDRFVTEQLAGDLLPDATDDQYIATAFHRNTMNNDEGGTDNEEFRIAALIDKVSTTWSVLQGTTMECVQCHSHPYDPIKHEDFYKSLAFFNQTADTDMPNESPVLVEFTEKEDQDRLNRILDWAEKHAGLETRPYYEKLVRVTEPKIHPHLFEQMDKGIPVKGTSFFSVTDSVYTRKKQVPFRGEDRIMLRVRADTSVGVLEFRLDHKEGEVIGNWRVRQKTKKVFDEEENMDKIITLNETISVPIKKVEGNRDLYLVLQGAEKSHTQCIVEWVSLHQALPGEGEKGYEDVEKDFYQLFNLEKGKVGTPIMLELKAEYGRETRLFEKGNWMVLGDKVEPGVPEKWNDFAYGMNRLGLAEWLVSPDNPLTARVTVNRFWEQLFGLGLVETLEDFGSQGFDPTHPELLDWLARRFIHEHEWDVKKLLKEIVMSAAYRQSSHMREDLLEKDPGNKMLARGPRIRLTAEQLRDQALSVSGLLSKKMYGASVMPEQPEGIWQVVYSGDKWETSTGEDRYRRALYTFWRRTSPYPSFIAFDAPSREFCLPRRIDTNTPIQALVTLNDPVYLEAARELARKVAESSPSDARAQLALMYSMAMLRGVDEEKLEDLLLLHRQTQQYFEADPEAICQLIGEENETLAVLTVMANTIMNLDEFLMKS
ncbi:DUF1553 domain-containing protein [Negadavirga shengliensis]|uniref:DUF1553 domain-containing protein n=1 Tax=Negadavirga shengliensis TaxID=1389218 RepID=A0ABV9T7Y0_9BACT